MLDFAVSRLRARRVGMARSPTVIPTIVSTVSSSHPSPNHFNDLTKYAQKTNAPPDLTDHLGFGPEKRRNGNLEILSERATFRDAFREMLQSVVKNGHSFDHCAEVLKQSKCYLEFPGLRLR